MDWAKFISSLSTIFCLSVFLLVFGSIVRVKSFKCQTVDTPLFPVSSLRLFNLFIRLFCDVKLPSSALTSWLK